MRFEFASAGRIIFGPGTIGEIGDLAAVMGRRALLVTGKNVDRAAPVIEQLKVQGITIAQFSIPGEPTTDLVLAAVDLARRGACEFVIGMGGGSVLDSTKAVIHMVAHGRDDLAEVLQDPICDFKPLMSHVAFPTTSGTGCEISPAAVIYDEQEKRK